MQEKHGSVGTVVEPHGS